jgi:hypothetical protein
MRTLEVLRLSKVNIDFYKAWRIAEALIEGPFLSTDWGVSEKERKLHPPAWCIFSTDQKDVDWSGAG